MEHKITRRGGESSLIKHLCLILLIVSIAVLFVSCEEADSSTSSPTMCTVTYYNFIGGNRCLITKINVEKETVIEELPIPSTGNDYSFSYWATNSNEYSFNPEKVNLPYTITEDTDFYAFTVKNSAVKTNGMIAYTILNNTSGDGFNYVSVTGVAGGDNLSTLVIPETCTVNQENSSSLFCTVKEIIDYAFYEVPQQGGDTTGSTTPIKNYNQLTWVYLPSTITKIGEKAFYDCTELTYINFNGTEEEWKEIALGNDWIGNSSNEINEGNGIEIYCYDPTKGKVKVQATVTFNFDNGDDIENEKVKVNYGAKVKPIISSDKRFIKPGYEFQNWKLNNEQYDLDTLVVTDIELVADWGDAKSTITITLNATDGYFKNGDGTTTTTETTVNDVLYNDLLSNYKDKLVEPTLDGYNFDGWYDAKVGGNKYELTDRITAGEGTAITFYAHWTENTDN